MNKIKNIGIIAHVDHGKTTLVDAMLKQTGVFRENQEVIDRVMDSDELERERGITIFSKNASFNYGGYKINIVDTPGHVDFGGEVQRILKMVDSVLLLVDAFEGPMPQTKYVLKKSLELGLKVIVVINKIDRANSRPHEVLDNIFDLFIDLNADDRQLDFPVVYTSARDGIAKSEMEDESEDLEPLFKAIIEYVDDTKGDPGAPFQFLVSAIEYDSYVGKIGTGKIHGGKIKVGDRVVLIKGDASMEKFKVSKLYAYSGLEKVEMPRASAGDIISIAGCDVIDVGETVADIENPHPLPVIEIDRPTLAIEFMVNDSPFSGQDGKFVTSRHIWGRLQREIQSNVSIQVEKTRRAESFRVKGRGELQLAVLIENMRREGYELQLSRPKVIFRKEGGKTLEPIEHATIDVADEFTGTVIGKLSRRKGEMIKMTAGSDNYTRLEFLIPSRGLLGYRNEFITDTRGTGILNHIFYEYGFYRGDIESKSKGALISMNAGEAAGYALDKLRDRGIFFIEPGEKVYGGMIVGANNRDADLMINVCKTKKMTNVRAAGADDALNLSPAKKFTLEQGLEFIDEDELMEVTPNHIRFRKKILDHNKRKSAKK
ncbi:MAG: translational GTPase TypA [Elusimicrobiota bacterium]|nr:translational GTPase TypA [Elusimicrobiota bacterium]